MFPSLSTTLLLVFLVHATIHMAAGAPSAAGKVLVRRQVKAIKEADSLTQSKLLTNRTPIHDVSKEHDIIHQDRKEANERDRKWALETLSTSPKFSVYETGEIGYMVFFTSPKKDLELMLLLPSEDSPTGYVLKYKRRYQHHHVMIPGVEKFDSGPYSAELDYTLDSEE